MKRLASKPKSVARKQRIIASFLSAVFVLSSIMTGTAAWADARQHKTNIAEGDGVPKLSDAILQKYEKDTEGIETEIPVSGAVFALYRVNADGTATLLRSFVTGADGQVLATDLEAGDYYWQEMHPAIGYLPETEDGQPKKYPFSVPTENGNPILSTAYNIRQQGKLAVTKTVQNSDNSALTAAQRNMLFEFTITFSDDGSYVYTIDGGAEQTVASGGKIYLKSGQTAQFDAIPTGVHYQIIEKAVTGYSTSSENNAGHIPESGITASFTNLYSVPGHGTLTIEKTITGANADLTKKFTFTAVIGDTTETFTLGHNETKIFNNIPYGTDYKITEDDYSDEHYIPENREYIGTITDINRNISLPFVNHYDDNPEPEPGNLTIRKAVQGANADLTKEFTFNIVFEGEGAPDSPQTFTLKHGEDKTFPDIPQGVVYTVTETGNEGYSPDFETTSGVIAGDQTITVHFINRISDIERFKLTVIKRVVGNPPESDQEKRFNFTLDINGEKHEFSLKAGEISQEFIVYTGDVYVLTEDDYAMDGYVQSGVINGFGVVGSNDIVVTQFNSYPTPERIDINGKKTWNTAGMNTEADLPDSITIYLKNGDVIVATTTTDQNKNWEYEFKDIPKTNALGVLIHYTVEEVRIPGWYSVITGYDIENFYQPPVTVDEIKVEKSIVGAAAPAGEVFTFVLTAVNDAPMPDKSEIQITGAGIASFGPIDYTVPGTYIYTITEVDGGARRWIYDESVYTLTVLVTEDAAGNLQIGKELTKNGLLAEKVLFTNFFETGGTTTTTSVRVTKVWEDNNSPNRPTSVQVQLYRNGTPYGNPVTLSAANDWTRVWSGLSRNAVWSVDEVSVPDGYTKIISGDQVNGFVITNSEGVSEKDSITVTKVWKGEDDNRPTSVAIQLYKEDVAVGAPILLSESNQWTYTWNGLEKGPSWTVDEVNVPNGYSKVVTGDAANGFVVTNTKVFSLISSDDDKVFISGQKTWNHGNNPIEKRPASITLFVKEDGVIILQKLITEAEHWSWSIRVDRYAADGHEIVYTVDEARINDYQKTITGYSIYNTYTPGMDTDGSGHPGGSVPKTGDNNQLYLWLTTMILSFMGLSALAFTAWRRKKHYTPLH